MQDNLDVTVLGTIVFDIFIEGIKNYPKSGQAVEIDSLPYFTGGCGANTSIVLSKLGLNVSLIGAVGDDLYGNFILDYLKNCGVDVSLVKVSKKESTSTSILFINDKKERSYFHLVGASKEIEVNKRELDKIFKSKIFHVGGVNLLPGLDGKPLAEVLRKVKSKNVITSVDLAWDVKNRWMKNLKHSLPFIDILMANEDEIKALTGEKNLKRAINFLHREGLKIVVVKLGKDGSIVSKNFDFEYVPPFKIKSKDSTGAGDAFAGGFLYGLLKSKSLFESALIGNYVGALATTEVGSTSAFINLTEKEIDKILSRTKL